MTLPTNMADWPICEALQTTPARESAPQQLHADYSGQSLAVIVGTSEVWVPTCVVSLRDKSGPGSVHCVEDSQFENMAFAETRRRRWARVDDAGSNTGKAEVAGEAGLPVVGPGNAPGKFTRLRYTSRDKASNSEGCRSALPRGDALFIEGSLPHGGPGKASGEGQRRVLYVSWAAEAAGNVDGRPIYLHQKGLKEGTQQKKVFEDGLFTLGTLRHDGRKGEKAAAQRGREAARTKKWVEGWDAHDARDAKRRRAEDA